ncbi:MAG: hypothetical protein WCT05_09985 [Lentisphaeria bacterium]
MRRLLIYCLNLFLLSSLAALETDFIKLHYQPDANLRLENKNQKGNWKTAELQAFMIRSNEANREELVPENLRADAQGLHFQFTRPAYRWQLQLKVQGKLLLLESTLTNLSDQELLLEPGWQLKVPDLSPLSHYWDGFAHLYETAREDPVYRYGIKGEEEKHVGASTMPFPVGALGGSQDALYLGAVPFDPISYTAGAFVPAEKKLQYSLRVVLSPGQSLQLRQTIGGARAIYGMQEAIVQQYYESFPELWQVVHGQENPYTWANHAHYQNWWGQPKAEDSRRLQMKIEWCYCPYKRSGDMYGKDELWDYQAKNPFRSGKPECGGVPIDFGSISAPDYREHRRNRFREYARQYGWMFYNTTAGTWCELQLAQKKYPDAITHDKSVMYILNSWSTHHDQEIRVFPMATSFAEEFEKDLVSLAEDLNVPGFALDCAYGGAYYRGSAVKKSLPGRAWDEEGVFIDQSVAINHQVDFIHQIYSEPEKKLTAFINGYLKGDFVMVETPYLNIGKFRRWMPLLRWYIGPRPGCVHGHGFLFKDIVPDWRNKSPEYFQELMPKLSDFIILNQFKYGLTNSYLTMYGNPQQIYIFPEAFELMRAGWQAELPLILEDGMRVPYLSRYGSGVQTYFFLGNSGAEDVEGQVRFDNQALIEPGWALLWNRKMRQQASTENQLDGVFTQVQAQLPSRVPVLYESVAALRSEVAKQQVLVKADKDLDRQIYHLHWQNKNNFEGQLRFRTIRHFDLQDVRLNGKTVPIENYQSNKLDFAPNSKLEITYQSQLFHLPEKAILEFPFSTADGKLHCQVQVEKGNEAALALAERFTTYFAFCKEKKLLPDNSPELNILETKTMTDAPNAICILLDSTTMPKAWQEIPSGISRNSSGTLQIRAKDIGTAELLLEELFQVMDKRFEYIFPFRYVMGLHRDMLVHFKMLDKHFPYHKYFEVAP